MKKCLKCNVIFHLDPRTHCLYCDTRLVDLEYELVGALARRIQRDETLDPHQRTQYIIASYFKVRSLPFVYQFDRNQMKWGKDFPRFLVQPLQLSSILKIPWVIVDFIDSCLFRLIYSSYCEKCGWKYVKRSSREQGHNPDECAYNQEYSVLIDEILSGRISSTEARFERTASHKVKAGKRSAYFDLCFRKKKWENLIDIFTVWLSVCLVLAAIVLMSLPIVDFVDHELRGRPKYIL